MKRYLILLACFLVFIGVGCNLESKNVVKQNKNIEVKMGEATSTVSTTVTATIIVTTSTAEEKNDDSQYYKTESGYYAGVSDGYIWKDGKKLTEITLDFYENGNQDQNEYILKELDIKGQKNLYVVKVGGCGGCAWMRNFYFQVNQDGSLTYHKFKTTDSQLYLGDLDGLFSPDKSKLAFVRGGEKIEPVKELDSIWIFDLLTGEEKGVGKLKDGKVLFNCKDNENLEFGPDCEWNPNKISWKDNQELVVKVPTVPLSKSEIAEGSFSKYYGVFRDLLPQISNLWIEKIYSFDFDNDGINEYIVFYNVPIQKKVEIFGETITSNGAIAVFKLTNDEWKKVYEDEGTVGKEGYGVYSEMGNNSVAFVDIDQDGNKEIEISTSQDGSGHYVDSYILKWNGEKIAKADFKETKTKKELKEEFLMPGEELGPGDLSYDSICGSESEYDCTYRQDAPGAVGKIVKNYKYKNGLFVVDSYQRVNY